MQVTIDHAKTNNIADWTQAELDIQIAAGNFPPGTVLADIVQPSDWNNAHSSILLEQNLERVLQTLVIIDMAGANYTMTDAEANSVYKIITNASAPGLTLTWPTTADDWNPLTQYINMAFAANGITLQSQTGGSTLYVDEGLGGIPIQVIPGTGVFSTISGTNHTAREGHNGILVEAGASVSTYRAMHGCRVYCSNGGAVTFTIEPASTADLGENATFRLQAGAGGITIAAGAGVTLVGSTTVAAYDCITCDRDGTTDTWYL